MNKLEKVDAEKNMVPGHVTDCGARVGEGPLTTFPPQSPSVCTQRNTCLKKNTCKTEMYLIHLYISYTSR